jgi:Caspase domain
LSLGFVVVVVVLLTLQIAPLSQFLLLTCFVLWHIQYNYIQDFYGFQDEDITTLVDDGDHPQPTKAAILHAYRRVVAQSQPGDSIFLHYSGHGTKVPDQNGDEEDGYDEALVPSDYTSAGIILDDDLYEILVKNLVGGVHVVSVVSTECIIRLFPKKATRTLVVRDKTAARKTIPVKIQPAVSRVPY